MCAGVFVLREADESDRTLLMKALVWGRDA